MRFSQRIGKRPIKVELEREGISQELRNSLWTILVELILSQSNEPKYSSYGQRELYSELTKYFRDLWIYFFKRPIDNLPVGYSQVDENRATGVIRKWFFESEWELVFDFIEFSSSYHPKFQETCNLFLQEELSAYRFIDGKLTQINSPEEISEVETAIKNSDKWNSVKTHLKRAVELYSDRKAPDFRNSIKESISAVESLLKILVKDEKTTLGQALKLIENKYQIPGSLKSAFTALYGYTSDEGGIRHSLLESGVKVGMAEARFMLITCSAFVNYLLNII
jgi:hypothetical protein